MGDPHFGQCRPPGQGSPSEQDVAAPVSPLIVRLFGSTFRGGTSGLLLSFRKQFLLIPAAGLACHVQPTQALSAVQDLQQSPIDATVLDKICPVPKVAPGNKWHLLLPPVGEAVAAATATGKSAAAKSATIENSLGCWAGIIAASRRRAGPAAGWLHAAGGWHNSPAAPLESRPEFGLTNLNHDSALVRQDSE